MESSTPQHSYSTATAVDFLKQFSKYSTAVKKQLYSTTQHFTAVFTAVHSYCVKKYWNPNKISKLTPNCLLLIKNNVLILDSKDLKHPECKTSQHFWQNLRQNCPDSKFSFRKNLFWRFLPKYSTFSQQFSKCCTVITQLFTALKIQFSNTAQHTAQHKKCCAVLWGTRFHSGLHVKWYDV